MSPSPVTYTLPSAPATYSWEATDEAVAARYGIPESQVVRFDLNTSPAPPGLAARVLASGTFESSLSEYPPGDYRRLTEAAARVYGVASEELVVGAGADEVLEMAAKAFLRQGDAAIVPIPTYAMYRVVTEQRGGRSILVPRRPADEGYVLDHAAIREAAADAALLWLCDPNNPTGHQEPEGSIERLLDGLAADADAADRQPPMVVLDEAYYEFVERTHLDLRHRFPNLVIVRTASKAYGLAGLRVGFGLATPGTIDRLATYRPPGSIATPSITVVTAAFEEQTEMRANVERVLTERPRFIAGLRALGFDARDSVTNFVLVDLGSAVRASTVAEGLLRHGIVPRTFPAGHPLAHCLRLTVRSRKEDDRLLAAAADLASGLAGDGAAAGTDGTTPTAAAEATAATPSPVAATGDAVDEEPA